MKKSLSVLTVFLALAVLLTASFASAADVDADKELEEALRLNDKMVELYQESKYAEATALGERILEIHERVLGPEHPETATALNNLAFLYDSMGEYVRAEPLYKRALAIREKVLGPEHPDTATSLNNLALLYDDMGDYARSEPLYKRALAILEKVLGPEHPDTATALNNLAWLYDNMGDYVRAEPLYKRALAIAEKSLGPEHPTTARSLNNLAALYYDMGDYARAESLYERALAIREKVLGLTHPDTAQSLDNMAELYRTMGDYAKAEPFYKRALVIYEEVLGPEDPDTAITINNLAGLYYAMGDYARAEPLLKRALTIDEKVLGSEHPSTAIPLSNLAELYRVTGDYARAEPLYERALTIYEKVLGPEHPNTAMILNNLALLYVGMGDYVRTEGMYKRALAIYEKVFGPEHPDTAMSLNNLAGLYKVMGEYAKAEPMYKRALAIHEKALGPEHPYAALSLENLALLYGTMGRNNDSLELFIRGEAINDRAIENVFTIATEEQKLKFVNKIQWGYHGVLSLIHRNFSNDQEALRAGLNLVLSRKGIVFDAQARENEAISNSLDPETKELWAELAKKRGALAKLLQNKPNNLSDEDYRNRIETLNLEVEVLEGDLSSKSALVAEELKQRKVTTKEAAAALPKDALLMEFVKIQDYDWAGGDWVGTYRYLAFILKPNGSVKLVDLGVAKELEGELKRSLEYIKNVSTDEESIEWQVAASRHIYSLVFKHLEGTVGNAEKLFISPDGILNLIPFNAMMGDDDKFLVERYTIAYLTSGREVAKGDVGIKADTDLLLIANPMFDTVPNKDAKVAGLRGTTGRSANFSMSFAPLPGTAREAREIPSLIKGKRKKILTGAKATEEAVLSTSRPRILHLSTHGFFLKDQESITLEGSRGAGGTATLPKDYENPLMRSGLAFAGANRASEATTSIDGLLTAFEVSGMDLYGTDLVTLSACETGVGDIKTGEGVFGLRRAFSLAGAKNLLMSLWPVGDDTTAEQMSEFYRLYGKGKTPSTALREAQLKTIAKLRKEYSEAPPALWAPFILQGR